MLNIFLYLIAFFPMLGVAIVVSMWSAWWLQPLWTPVLGPLGVPPLSYWQFFALGWFWSAFKGRSLPAGDGQESDQEKANRMVVWIVGIWLSPVLAFYIITWALGGTNAG